MRKFYFLSACFSLFCVFSAQAQLDEPIIKDSDIHHCFFEENSISGGIGAPYSLEFNQGGFNTRFYFNYKEHIGIGPEFTFLRTGDLTIFDVDIVGHYVFELPLVGVYPMIGANYTYEDAVHSEEAFGFVWGAGVHRNINRFTLFAEYTRIESDLQDSFVTAGVLFTFTVPGMGGH